MHDLRCAGTMHARVLDDQYLEVKCGRRSCGHKPGVVVLHKFNIHTGKLVDTRRFADPRKGTLNARNTSTGAPVRSA